MDLGSNAHQISSPFPSLDPPPGSGMTGDRIGQKETHMHGCTCTHTILNDLLYVNTLSLSDHLN